MISAKNTKYNIGDKILIDKHWYFKKGDTTEILDITKEGDTLWLKDTRKTFMCNGKESPGGICTYTDENNIFKVIKPSKEDTIVIIIYR